ncbi:hypothetical protein BKA65DRAFT_458560 [Rhexocercosporidium sp. MPI-PUGE-AT-0058]|nr:hypothetical protein BKA65DRAFT_458560 [Rhexocercosporidium sp. MPI-PUGE-AT-0058]
MVYHPPYSTPDSTPLAPEIIEASTPWSDVLLEDLRTTIQFNPTTRLIRKYRYGYHETRLRSWGKALWLSLFVVYVGRWLVTADETHKDGSFPGIFQRRHNQPSTKNSRAITPTLPFLPLTNTSSAAPISLLVRIDDEEYLVLPNAMSLVSICRGNLTPNSRHEIRIIAPMVGGETAKGAHQRRMLEIVTDLPGSLAGKDKSKSTGTSRGVLGGVMGWEYLLGEMFGSDHVTIGNDGMCLIPDCIEGRGSPAGLADVFFQSGPAGSEQYDHPWFFQEYTPDVIVMNIGSSDWDSFQTHTQEYNKTLWELSVIFEETYVTMIQAIRTLAYPKYSAATMDASRYIYSAQNAAAGVPIFIMRPFRGQLEQATHAVVDRLRKDGDKSVFWLDTSGWLNTEVDFDGRAEDQDFFLDEDSATKQWRLTERGNQRVAILLHMHVCRYLAREVDRCAFLPPEIYLGTALDHDAIRLNEFLEDEKERKLKKLFWN